VVSTREEKEEPTSLLSLVWRAREGTPSDQPGARHTPRAYLDFVIDGESLFDALRVGDRVGFLADWPNLPSIGELLPEGRSELPPELEGAGRRLLYVCPECGDVYCGATTAIIVGDNDRIVWKDFADLNWDWSGDSVPVFDDEQFGHIGPFYFDRTQYVNTLRNPPPRPVPPSTGFRNRL
jgi:hypothetical protein